jgi:hypothetical protein
MRFDLLPQDPHSLKRGSRATNQVLRGGQEYLAPIEEETWRSTEEQNPSHHLPDIEPD